MEYYTAIIIMYMYIHISMHETHTLYKFIHMWKYICKYKIWGSVIVHKSSESK